MQISKRGCYSTVYYLFFIVVFNACQPQKEVKQGTALCIWPKGSVRSEPSRESAWMSSLHLGQQMAYLGSTARDSTDKNHLYYHVCLTDGTKGWVSEFVVVLSGQPAIVLHPSCMYIQPDSTTEVVKKMNYPSFVAIDEEMGKWVHVVTPRRANEGWVLRKDLSEHKADVTKAIAYQQAMVRDDSLKQLECISKINREAPSLGSDMKAVSHSLKIQP
ncbi:MAG: hypothetical protein ACQESW_08210 [Bacteroidota bacterium]